MKIALYELLTTVSPGGIQTSYWETAKRLLKMGHEVHLYGGKGSIRWQMPKGLKILLFPFIDRNKFPDFGTRFRKFAERLSFGRHTLKPLMENRYDIIYIRKPFEMPLMLYVKQKTGSKVVFRSGGTEFFPGYRLMAKKLDSLLACSHWNAEQIKNYADLEPRVIYNGVDVERFIPLPKNPRLGGKYGIKPEDFVVLSVGRLVGWKGFQYGIQALRFVKDFNKIKYLIVGSGEYERELKRLAKQLGVESKVFFLGRVENKEVPFFYSIADIALFPTIGADDAFPNSLCEAMACGKVCIGSEIGGIPEAIKDGQTGFLVPPRDAHAIAGKIDFLSRNKDLLETMGVKARQRVVDNFSWDIIVKKLAEIFRSLVDKPSGESYEL